MVNQPFSLNEKKKKTSEDRERQVGFLCPRQDLLLCLETGIVTSGQAVLSLTDFLAKDNCPVLGKATLHNSVKETSQEAMEPVGIRSKNQRWFEDYSKIKVYRNQAGRGSIELCLPHGA